MRRVVLSAVALVLFVAPTLVACSSDTDDTATAGGETVTVEHSYGTTTIEGTPERIVATSSQWLDALVELGVQPIAYYSAGSYGDERGLYPWQTDVSPDAVALSRLRPAHGPRCAGRKLPAPISRSARMTWTTALMSARWVNACGKFPR